MNIKINPIKFNNPKIYFQSKNNRQRIYSFSELGDVFKITNSENSAKEIGRQEILKTQTVKDKVNEMKAKNESGTIYYSGDLVKEGTFYETYDGKVQVERNGYICDYTGRALIIETGKVVGKVVYKNGKIIQKLK